MSVKTYATTECIINRCLSGRDADKSYSAVLPYLLPRMISVFYFTRYFDIFEMAVEVYHGFLIDDVLELCDIYPVNQQHRDVDYLMIALAYRLTSFDHDPAWENYLTLE